MGLSKNLLVCPPNVIAKLSDISLLSVNLSVVVCKYGGFDVSIWSYSIISIGVSVIVGMIVSLMTQSQLVDKKTLNEATVYYNESEIANS